MRPYREPKRRLLTLGVVLIAMVSLTFALVGCDNESDEPMEPGPGEEPMEPGPGEAEPWEPDPGEEPTDPEDIAAPPGEAEEIPPIDEATIKNLTAAASTLSASQVNVMDYDNFGAWAAAYVGASGQESQLAIFFYSGVAWTLADMGSYVEAGDLPPGIPSDVSNWAFP